MWVILTFPLAVYFKGMKNIKEIVCMEDRKKENNVILRIVNSRLAGAQKRLTRPKLYRRLL